MEAGLSVWAIYAVAALCEIGGCFAFWAWLREGQSPLWALPGALLLIAFAWALTRVPADASGRAFAAYGGVYIAASVLWLWLVERQSPTRFDLLGAVICLAGAAVILFGARVRGG